MDGERLIKEYYNRHATTVIEYLETGVLPEILVNDTSNLLRLDCVRTRGEIASFSDISYWKPDERKYLLNAIHDTFDIQGEGASVELRNGAHEELHNFIWDYCQRQFNRQGKIYSRLIDLAESSEPKITLIVPPGRNMFLYVKSGNQSLRFGGINAQGTKGSFYLFPDSSIIEIEAEGSCEFYVSEFVVEALRLGDHLSNSREIPEVRMASIQDVNIQAIICKTYEEILFTSGMGLSNVHLLHINMLEKLYLFFRESKFREEEMLDPRVRKACRYIDEHYNKKFTVQEVAAAAGTSCSTISALFRNALNCNIIKWRDKRRIERAKLLLVTSDMPVKSVAFEVGYDDPLFFSRRFKQGTGLSPTDIRQKSRRNSRPNPAHCSEEGLEVYMGYSQKLVHQSKNLVDCCPLSVPIAL